ncbi:hypothetical protein [Catellatospora citrea]|uniref:Uncharacterized protein n=1 Tax=Catellatospora citrea TaxID=53366 RepID=A0A8J3KVH0_9ACTN|nr:hypothetical protein [Catellatospora citrea]RKE09960.1 hypothetical protein C8E86_4854 [Catellatospora citrea]GIG01995.1 hypothetical protein Cci01nite_70880 [Catellatospora citrea]
MTDEVRLNFTPTAGHWHWVYQTWGTRRWTLIRTVALCALVAGLLLLANGGGVSAWVLIVGGAVCWFLPYVVVRREVRGLPPIALAAREIVLSADAVEVTTAQSYSRYAASLVSAQHVNAGGLLLFNGSQVLSFIPRDAVHDEQFEQACRLAAVLTENGRAAPRVA